MPHVWFDDTVTVPSSTPGGVWFDATTYGATGDGATDDTGSLQAAIDAAVDAGGGVVWIGPGTYRLTSALTIQMDAATTGVQVCGSGTGTKLSQQTTADVFQIGRTGAEVADNVCVRDLWLSGGRYGLNLNNALRGLFSNLLIQGQTVGIYLQGQNESHIFQNLQIVGCSLNGIAGAYANGGTGSPAMDFPVVQKCVFDHIRISGTLGGTAMILTAGVLGSQQVSGANYCRGLLFESNARGTLLLEYAFNTSIDGMSTEESLDADNTYSSLLVDHQSTVTARNLQIGSAGSNNFKYYVNVNSGNAFLSDSTVCVGGVAGTSDVFATDTLTLQDTYVSNSAAVTFASAVAKHKAMLVNVRDSAGAFIDWADQDLAYISRDAAGVVVGGTLSSYFAVSAAMGGTTATSGAFRSRHAPSGGLVTVRDQANSTDYTIMDWGTPTNEVSFGHASVATRLRTSLTTPTSPANGDVWVEFTGTTPNRQLRVAVKDGGTIYYVNVGATH